MKTPKSQAIKKKTVERFEHNAFAKSYREKNERHNETREHEKIMSGIPSCLNRKKK